MEEQRKIVALLDQIPYPGFLVSEKRIQSVNPSAAALLLVPGQSFPELICVGAEDYAAYEGGQFCLSLSIGGHIHSAMLDRIGSANLVLLDQDAQTREYQLLSLLAMELRRPLTQAFTSTRGQSCDPRLNKSLMQMLRMVGNMADLGRYAHSSRMELQDVDSFLLEVFEKARDLAAGKADITFEGLKQPVFSLMDAEQLERAVWNILANCIGFAPQGVRIHARLTRQGNRLRLTVEDNGSGIPEHVRPTLFHRYLRQPGIEDCRYGLGLGLSIVRIAAANHGGTVLIGTGDQGTRITMTIALRQEDSSILRSPLLRPDYAGGWDHGLVELSGCLPSELYCE